MKISTFLLCKALLFLFLPSVLRAEDSANIFDLSLEEALDIKVTSVTKSESTISKTPAAVFVVTQEDIRRSGATSLPEVLRMVPGLQVARLSSSQTAIGSRGFNGLFSNKLLVLIDGRTIYSPIFSGVNWDLHHLPLHDIQQIEVIRGPGATVWGANAVNGVINITTKHARDSQGVTGRAGVGTEDQGIASTSYGMKLAKDTWGRAYGNFFDRDNSAQLSGEESKDSWRGGQTGFRVDKGVTEKDKVTVQGDFFGVKARGESVFPSIIPPFSVPVPSQSHLGGGNLLTRWSHTFSEKSDADLQFYFDHFFRKETVANEEVNTYDFDFTHRYSITNNNRFIWGGGYRFIKDGIEQVYSLGGRAVNKWYDRFLSNVFLQDEYQVSPTFSVVAGSKFEYNEIGGTNVQPGLRMMWTPTDSQSVWGAVSRAVRTPARAERNLVIPVAVLPTQMGIPALIEGRGSVDFKSEVLYAYEVGYRLQATKDLFFDVALFYNHYTDLESLETGDPELSLGQAGPQLVIPINFGNKRKADVTGIEFLTEWRPARWWKLQGWYAFLNADISLAADSRDTAGRIGERGNAQGSAYIRSLIDLPYGFAFDVAGRWIDTLGSGTNLLGNFDIGQYIECDVRLGWQPSKNIEFSLIGQNLLNDKHREYKDLYNAAPNGALERSFLAQVAWKFD